MGEFYEIDSTRVSLREYWWGTKSPLILVAVFLKLFRIRIPGSSDDPNTDSTLPFVVEALPPDVAAGFAPAADELAAAGFSDPVFHVIQDAGTRTAVYWATYRHESGQHFARIHQRIWQQSSKPNRGTFVMFFTEFSDGTFFVSSSGKPDMSAPETVSMNRMYRAKTPALWQKHLALVEKFGRQKLPVRTESREDLAAATERHHVLVRDFHLGRGVFRRRTAEEQAKADSFAASVAAAQAGGLEHPEIMAELDKLQERKPGWGGAVWVLAGSAVLFLAAGVARDNWKFTLWLIPALLFHEAGHWIAMRVFKYRNLRMFFIPLFGAAVTGQNWNVPGWKKALVSLAGPLPGIALGIALGMVGMILHKPFLNEAAFILIILNGFNLLPILPLDGGHVLQSVLFCRNRWLDVGFRVLAILGMLGLAAMGLGRMLIYIVIPMVIYLPVAMKLGRVTDSLRKASLPEPSPEEDRIPTATAQSIITELKNVLPKTTSNKILAQYTVNVFETLNAKPPGALGTLGLLAAHGAGIFFTVVFGSLLLVAKQGGFGDFLRAATRQPQHVYECGTAQTWPSGAAARGPQTFIVASLPNRTKALAKFQLLTNQLPADAGLTSLGDSLILALPAGDDAARERWFDEFQTLSTNSFVAVSNQPVNLTLTCLAPTAEAATNLTRKLRDYLQVTAGMHLTAPWSPAAQTADFARQEEHRRAWRRIETERMRVWTNSALKAFGPRIAAASKRGAAAESRRLYEEKAKFAEELQKEHLAELRGEEPYASHPWLIDLHERLEHLNYTNRTERAALMREIAGKLGEVPYQDSKPAPGAADYGAAFGTASHHGLMVEISWIGFFNPAVGAPALLQWLCDQQCLTFRYDFEGSFLGGLEEDEE
ncbi:MAG: site-2 protease family protein [Verrucomicrobiota bacterium]